MSDWIWFIFKWALIALAMAPMVIGLGWAIVEGSILPRLVPKAEIEALAEELMRLHPDDPEEFAFIEEQAAWHRSHSFEQGKWHRVRRQIKKRLKA